MRRGWASILLTATMAASLAAGRPVGAQEAEEAEAPDPSRFRVSDRQFDHWLFEAEGDAASARRIIEARLKSRIGSIDQVCVLSRSQRKKLEVAGRGDIKRFFDRMEDMRERIQHAGADLNQLRELILDVQTQGRTARFQLFEEGSMFSKTLGTTLAPEQAARYRIHWDFHRLHRHQSRVEWVARTLQKSLSLGDAERLALHAVLLEETRPPRNSGPSDYYGIIYQASRIPEDKLRPILDEADWRLLRLEFEAARRQEPMLRESGLLPEDRPAWDSARGVPTRDRGDDPGPAPAALGRSDAGDGPSATREKRAS